MAAFAFPAFLSLVHIILSMAGVTGLAQFFLAKHSLVTGSAFDSVVFAPQGKSAFLEVIETCPGPAVGGVTFFALGAELALMALAIIVFAMAGITLARGFLVVLVGMT
jgi:hypothetical protein